MKKVIDQKVYDTKTATELHSWDNGKFTNDVGHVRETLYRQNNGTFFIYGEGGALTEYAVYCGNNSTAGSENIRRVDREEAVEWLERHDGAEVLTEHFSEELEQA